MGDDRQSQAFSEVRRLIRLETDEALKACPADRFRQGLEARMRSGPEPKAARPFIIRRLVPAFMAVGLAVAGALVLRTRLTVPPQPQAVSPFEAFVQTLPVPSRTDEPALFVSSPLAGGLERTIQRVWDDPGVAGSVPPSSSGGEVPRLTVEQRMEILFREQAIHRFLTRHFNITLIKEVSSWSKKSWFYSA